LEAQQMLLACQLDEVNRLRMADSARFFEEFRSHDDRRRQAERAEALTGEWRKAASPSDAIATEVRALREVVTVGFSRLNEVFTGFPESSSASLKSLDNRMSEIGRELIGLRSDAAMVPSADDLRHSVDQLKASERHHFTKHFIPFRGSPLDGIITHLTRESGGHVVDKGVMEIWAKSHYSSADCYRVRNLADLGGSLINTDSRYFSKNEPDQWTAFDFRERRVVLTHYSIRSHRTGGPGWYHPKSWVIEVAPASNPSGWVEIDRKENIDDLNNADRTLTYAVHTDIPACRIRLRQIGLSHSNDNHLSFTRFEVFGDLMTPSSS
jgi:hypothetical protein